jgi:hypothetical protein
VERARGPAGIGSTAGRTELEQFEAFYDFAYPRVYRFAAKRMGSEAQAEALTELILASSLPLLGGAHAPDNGLRGDPAELAFRIFAVAQRVADQVADDPSLLSRPKLHLAPERPHQSSVGLNPFELGIDDLAE